MKFSRVDKKTILCIVSENELNAHGLEIEDLFEDKEKTENFLRKVVIKASEELNVEVDGNAYSAQMSIRDDGNISIMIMEDDGSLQQMMSKLFGHLDKLKESQGAETDTVEKEPSLEKQAQEMPLWIEGVSMDDIINMCRQIPSMEGINSELYKYDGAYFLRLEMKLDNKKLGGIILTVSEYAVDVFTEDNGGRYVMEHGTLLHKDAIETLKKL